MRRTLTVAFLLVLAVLVLAPGTALLTSAIGAGPRLLTDDPLYGVVLAAKEPRINARTLLSGEAQAQLESWLTEHMGAPRAKLIRMSNLLDFWAGRSANPGILIGRDRYLFTREMLGDWCLRGDPSFVDDLARRFARANERLRRDGKAFVVLISPNKAALHPDKLPAYCRPRAVQRARDRLVAELRQRGVPVVDSESVLLSRQDAARVPTFGQYGQHWNDIGRLETIRAVLTEIERQLGRRVGTLELESLRIDDQPSGTDADTGLLMNLAIALHPVSTHATLTVKDRGSPIDLMIVGTSFSDSIIGVLLNARLAHRVVLFNYFRRTLHFEDRDGPGLEDAMPPPVLFPAALDQSDVVLVEANAPALSSGHLPAFLSAVEALQ